MTNPKWQMANEIADKFLPDYLSPYSALRPIFFVGKLKVTGDSKLVMKIEDFFLLTSPEQ